MSVTRPQFSAEEAQRIAQQHWGFEASDCAWLPSYDDQNFRLREERGERGEGGGEKRSAVLKCSHAEESARVLELQLLAMQRAADRVAVPLPMRRRKTDSDNKDDNDNNNDEFVVSVHCPLTGRSHLCRLLQWVPGSDWAALSAAQRVLCSQSLGSAVGNIDALLQSLCTAHATERRQWVWRTSDFALLLPQRPSVVRRQTAHRLHIFDSLHADFELRVAPLLPSCSAGVVHNDCNDHNTLVDPDKLCVTGIIDWGDVCWERHCFSLGNTLYYAMLGMPLDSVLQVAARVIHGYQTANKLPDNELQLAFHGAKLRCCTSAVMSGATQELHPDDAYVGETEKPGWTLLDFIFDKDFATHVAPLMAQLQ